MGFINKQHNRDGERPLGWQQAGSDLNPSMGRRYGSCLYTEGQAGRTVLSPRAIPSSAPSLTWGP